MIHLWLVTRVFVQHKESFRRSSEIAVLPVAPETRVLVRAVDVRRQKDLSQVDFPARLKRKRVSGEAFRAPLVQISYFKDKAYHVFYVLLHIIVDSEPCKELGWRAGRRSCPMEQTSQLKLVLGKRWGTRICLTAFYPFIWS